MFSDSLKDHTAWYNLVSAGMGEDSGARMARKVDWFRESSMGVPGWIVHCYHNIRKSTLCSFLDSVPTSPLNKAHSDYIIKSIVQQHLKNSTFSSSAICDQKGEMNGQALMTYTAEMEKEKKIFLVYSAESWTALLCQNSCILNLSFNISSQCVPTGF